MTQTNNKHPFITILGRRWFQKGNGNTYHSVKVFVNGEMIGENPYCYGYGSQYVQTAFDILQKKGFYPKTNNYMVDYSNFNSDKIDHRDRFHIEVIDVKRKKDL